MPSGCNICPRRCGADREAGRAGLCGQTNAVRVARAAPHFWEEPCISGERGSGAVFFSGCALRCVYCQNYEISALGKGRELSVTELRELLERLRDSGVHNINLVNPTHFASQIEKALEQPLGIPVVYNCGGYENVETLRQLEGKISVYLPDLKYSETELAARYSGAADYFEVATRAITEMYRQCGDYVLEDGMMSGGVLIRHLVLPSHPENTRGVLRWVAGEFLPGEVMFSLMSQYTPLGRAPEFPEIARKLGEDEYKQAIDYMLSLGIDEGYWQETDSSSEAYVPDFDFSGL